jgi:hypothetical protein
MFDRVDMDVMDMPLEIVLVANGVFPKSPLPWRQIAVRISLRFNPERGQSAAEMSLDPSPSTGKIGIARR